MTSDEEERIRRALPSEIDVVTPTSALLDRALQHYARLEGENKVLREALWRILDAKIGAGQ